MKKNINKLTLGVALAAAATAYAGGVQAGAFQLNEQSISGQGTSFAGRASNASDASTVYGNPAGMSFLDRAQITAGATYLDVSNDIDVKEATDALGRDVSGSSGDDMVPGSTVPSFYYVQPVSDRVTLGFGVYAPYGVITDYDSDFQGRYHGSYSEVKVVTAQPTISYRINEKWAIGAGVTYNRIEGELTSNTTGITSDGEVSIEGDDEAWGYNVGVIFKPVPSTTLGLAYHSKVDYSLEGSADVSDLLTQFGTFSDSGDASLDVTLPESIDFGITHQIDDRWTVMAGATWVRWSRFDAIEVETDTIVGTIVEEQNYKDSWQYAVGLSYQLNPQWLLRTGLAYDNSPTVDTDRSVRIPTGDRTIFSVGAGWTPIPDLTIDMAYTYLWEDAVTVSLTDDSSGTFEAEYENEAHGFGLGATYRF
ncbi:OmpP1/FadL family transporter [Cobetia sp. L2A1]|uniref:OmpP1/FadL family transporter n=1 Tax=Cobetia sp. L2A1 TaxID=2686360 RepID=UPI00131B7E09|nr:TonB-dependent receptor [Cobetia sp. L2A1]